MFEKKASEKKAPEKTDAEKTLSAFADDYMSFVAHEQGCTKQTVYTYRSWLNAYLKWLDANGHPDSLASFTQARLREYQRSLSRRSLRPRTVRSAFYPLRALSYCLVDGGVIDIPPTDGLTMPKKDAALRATISVDEVRALLGAAERLYPERRRVLAVAMIRTLTQTGVRFTEWIGLRVEDVNLTEGTLLVVNGKGQKTRTTYPPQETMEALAAWLEARKSMDCQHHYLFAYDARRRVAENAARRLLEEVKAAAGLADHGNIKPHSLRHFFASFMLSNGASLKVVQAALGHTDVKTTAIYLHVDEREARGMAQFAAIAALPESALPGAVPSPGLPSDAKPKPAPEAPPTQATPVSKPTLGQYQRLRRMGPTRPRE